MEHLYLEFQCLHACWLKCHACCYEMTMLASLVALICRINTIFYRSFSWLSLYPSSCSICLYPPSSWKTWIYSCLMSMNVLVLTVIRTHKADVWSHYSAIILHHVLVFLFDVINQCLFLLLFGYREQLLQRKLAQLDWQHLSIAIAIVLLVEGDQMMVAARCVLVWWWVMPKSSFVVRLAWWLLN